MGKIEGKKGPGWKKFHGSVIWGIAEWSQTQPHVLEKQKKTLLELFEEGVPLHAAKRMPLKEVVILVWN